MDHGTLLATGSNKGQAGKGNSDGTGSEATGRQVSTKNKKKKSKQSGSNTKRIGNNGRETFLNLISAVTIEDAIRHTSRHVGRHGRLLPKQVETSIQTTTEDHSFSDSQYNIWSKRTSRHNTWHGQVVKHVPILANNEWRLELFQELLLGYKDIFMSFAIASSQCLEGFNAQSISNLAYAYALIDYVPVFHDSNTLFGHIEWYAIRCKEPRALATILWAYAKARVPSPYLFGTVTEIVIFQDLSEFSPRVISTILWAYATAEESSSRLFIQLADAVIASDIHAFNPQELKDIVWAFAKSGESAPEIFQRVGNAVIEKMDADAVASFTSQELSNISWAFATAKEYHPELFHSISIAATEIRGDFNAQEITNLLWAFATVHIIDKSLFLSFVPTAISLIGEFDIQNLCNIAWAFSISNVAAPNLFDQGFIDAVLEKEEDFHSEALSQLHQWQLWQKELNGSICLPPSLQRSCYEAFINNVIQISDFQLDVMCELQAIGFQPEEEVILPSGYSLDVLVQVDGQSIGVEADGPYHFIGRKSLGKTILKRRQVKNIDRIQVVSIPYWEWRNFGNNGATKKEYLCAILAGSYMSTADANAILHEMADAGNEYIG